MPGVHEYPATPRLGTGIRFRRATVEAVEKFKSTNPWKGTMAEREAKFTALFEDLKRIYNRPNVRLAFAIRRPYRHSGASYYSPCQGLVVLAGRFSVVTTLHEWAHVLGKDEYGACEWSTNLFALVFPEKMAKLRAVGHMLVRARKV